MSELKSLIEEYREKVKKNEAARSDYLTALGRHLFSSHESKIRGEPFKRAYSETKELNEKFSEVRKKIETIKKILVRLPEMNANLKMAAEELIAVKRENQAVFEKVGEISYSLYKEHYLNDAEHKDLFRELSDQEEEIRKTENEIKRFGKIVKEKPFFNKAINEGKRIYLRTRINLLKGKMPELYRKAGREICETGIIEEINENTLQETAKPYFENKDRIKRIEKQKETLKKEQKSLEEELDKIGTKRRYQKKMRELEEEAKVLDKQLQRCFISIGEIYYRQPPEDIQKDSSIEENTSQISLFEKKNEKYGKYIERLEAAVQLEEISSRLDQMKNRMGVLEEEIRRRQDEANALSEQIREVEREKKRLEKIRGPEESLLQKRP
ncbi:MAG: hypothetical protein DRP87_13575 [Spirochaetes bacterium]|nr:MAG: hypothetical protein DRP87_13575 [Spirochaetota bacterium]